MNPRLIITLASVAAVLVAALGLYWKGRLEGAARARPKIEAARAQAAVSGLETRGERESAQRVEVVIRQRDATARAVAQLTHDALISEDAHAPLDPARAARLRAFDRELCLAAALAGCTEDPDAGRGDPALRAPPPARAADGS